MRRTKLTRRRTTPRPAKRRELYDDYLILNPWSEWAMFSGWTINDKGKPQEWKVGTLIPATERHHIFSMNQRPDALSLLISQTFHEHRWSHRNLTASRVISIFCKLKKREFDLDEAYRWTGKRIDGWLGTISFSGELEWVEDLRMGAFLWAQELREGKE